MGLTQYVLVLVLAPFIAGIALVASGSRAAPRIGLAIAIVALALAVFGALGLATNLLPEGPSLIRVLPVGERGIVWRVDGFAVWLALGLVGWAAPVLVWMTYPRAGAVDRLPTVAPTGWALLAVSLGLGAVLNDNILLSLLCWGGVALVTWFLSRPAWTPPTSDEWVDLTLLVGGAILVTLAMLTVLIPGKSLSLFDLSGRGLVGFGNGFLIMLALMFAAGAYPFILWVRRVSQGIMTDAVGVLALVLVPLALAFAARLLPVMVVAGTNWPTLHVSILTIPLYIVWLVCGIATIAAAALTLLFERDLPTLTMMLGQVTIGWGFIALGLNDTHALVGFVLLLLAYVLGMGTLLAVWASCEWADRELDVASLTNLAAQSSPHALAALLGGLVLCGFPLLVGFSGMVTTGLGFLALGGIAALGGGLAWAGNAMAFTGFIRAIRLAFTTTADVPSAPALANEGWVLLLPLALLLVSGVAPELVLLGSPGALGTLATTSLLANGTSLNDLSTTALGFTLGLTTTTQLVWLPGLFWALALGAAIIIALATGLFGARVRISPVFTGGEPPDPEFAGQPIDAWDDLAVVPRSAFVLPGPPDWRDDIGNRDFWEAGDAESVDADVVVIEEDEIIIVEASEIEQTEDEEAQVVDADEQDDVADDEETPQGKAR